MVNINEEYRIAYCEILEILNHMEKEYVSRIPNKMLKFWKENASKDYDFKYDEEKSFKEQDISKKAKVILAIIYRDCYASPIERESILKGLAADRIKVEEEKRKKFDPNNIFDKSEITSKEMSIGQKGEKRIINENPLNVVEEGNLWNSEQSVTKFTNNFFVKIFRKIKNLFKKDN